MSNCIIITGMHRSGTSLFSSIIQRAGVNIGNNLLEPGEDNPRGYFEDIDFVDFHNSLLAARGKNILVDRNFTASITEDEKQIARKLIEQRSSLHLWGWKDPRTSLFLDLWNELLPQSKFIFLFRHPLDVLLSVIRRGEIYNIGFYEGLEAWYSYNRNILEFYRSHEDRCVLIDIYGALNNIETTGKTIVQKLKLPLVIDQHTISDLFHPSELRQSKIDPAGHNILRKIHSECLMLYDELRKYADIPYQQTNRSDLQSETKHLHTLVAFAQNLSNPLPMAQRRALLATLVAIVDTDAIELMITRVYKHVRSLDTSNQWHRKQHHSWKSEADRLNTILEEQRAWIKELEAARDYHAQQTEYWRRLTVLSLLGFMVLIFAIGFIS